MLTPRAADVRSQVQQFWRAVRAKVLLNAPRASNHASVSLNGSVVSKGEDKSFLC